MWPLGRNTNGMTSHTQSMETQPGEERQRRKSLPPQTPEQRLQRKVNFYKWMIGIVGVIFLAGFTLSDKVSAYATKDDLNAKAEKRDTDHKEVHKAVDTKIEKLNDRTVKIYGEQQASAARDRLVQTQMEYLIEASEPRARSGTRRRDMRRRITESKARVREVEDDPLSGLDF